jgi:hypothetical protein
MTKNLQPNTQPNHCHIYIQTFACNNYNGTDPKRVHTQDQDHTHIHTIQETVFMANKMREQMLTRYKFIENNGVLTYIDKNGQIDVNFIKIYDKIHMHVQSNNNRLLKDFDILHDRIKCTLWIVD